MLSMVALYLVRFMGGSALRHCASTAHPQQSGCTFSILVTCFPAIPMQSSPGDLSYSSSFQRYEKPRKEKNGKSEGGGFVPED